MTYRSFYRSMLAIGVLLVLVLFSAIVLPVSGAGSNSDTTALTETASPPNLAGPAGFRPYPIGWYSRIEHLDKLVRMADSGAGLVLPYSGAGEVTKVQRYLDKAQEVGVRVMLDRHTHPSRWEPPALEDLRQEVAIHQSHPALFGWYIADEPERYGIAEEPAYFEPIYTTIKSADPEHPVAMVHANKAQAEYLDVYDLLMIDYYPGWTMPFDGDEFNRWVRLSYEMWLKGKQFADTHEKAGFIAVGLGFGYDENGNSQRGTRDLTLAEYRFHTFSAVALGADGFLYWMEEDANATVHERVSQVIGEVQAIGHEMNNGTTHDPQISVNVAPDDLVYRYGFHAGRHVILAVNVASHDALDDNNGATLQNVRFQLPAHLGIERVEVMHENRSIAVENNSFTDTLSPFAVRTYAFTTAERSYLPLIITATQ